MKITDSNSEVLFPHAIRSVKPQRQAIRMTASGVSYLFSQMIKIVNSDPVLFTMTLESEQCSSRSSSSKRVNSSGPVEGFKSFYASVTGRDEIRAPE